MPSFTYIHTVPVLTCMSIMKSTKVQTLGAGHQTCNSLYKVETLDREEFNRYVYS